MSVATKNPFALLEEDSSRPSSPVSAPAPSAPAPPAPAATRGNQRARGGPASRGGKYYARGGAAAKSGDTGNLNQNGIEDAPAQERKFEGRGRGGRGGARGGSRGGRGGRQFDRHSQTGKVDTEKRVNQGWGAEEGNAELKAEEAAIVDASVEAAPGTDAAEWGAPAGGDADWSAPAATEGDAAAPAAAAEGGAQGGRPRREREPEEEDNTLTLEQYLAQQKEKESTVVPKLEGVRKANEGADGDIWKGAVALEKGAEEDAYFVGKSKAAPKARAKKEEKVFLEIDARFERPSRGGRGGARGGDDRGARGGGRGGPRGGRGDRGGPRGGAARSANNAPAVNVDDEKAFPSLS
ncbi:hypothetical protein FB45DRAFT_1058931 [Roridomyces roridus]|uniref:Hyaluronan/mRNA-binding protein domain-containing protein n=1 Tax=Roridomyces roridus TaxID=1738132 RepID=A0AAD7BUN7_9AGAR|nr:hypothetical protein FB45DRAFT_1058931 [Roridomyces roridus]